MSRAVAGIVGDGCVAMLRTRSRRSPGVL
jgi:hypothetical protein